MGRYSVVLCAALLAFTVASSSAPEEEIDVGVKKLRNLPGLWNSVLWRFSNGTGLVARDVLGEKLFRQVFEDSLSRSTTLRRILVRSNCLSSSPKGTNPVSCKGICSLRT